MSSKFTIKQIFEDHWESFMASTHSIRPIVISEVSKMLGCGDLSKGYRLFYCRHCDHFHFVPFRCKSRFCNTCGTAYQQDRSDSISFKLINCRHRHIVFTIPQQLRVLFRKNRTLLDLLFQASAQVISSWFYERNHNQHFTPGIVSSIHTFGHDLKWNPHIHMLVFEGACGDSVPWKSVTFFPYTMLRKKWQTILLELLEQHFGKDAFRSLKSQMYSNNKDGFYVHAPRTEFNSPKAIANYITRYIGRPAMTQSRIKNYDGQSVSFWYLRHEDNKRQDETIPAFEFIQRLIIHIHKKAFHTLRYYGLYAKKHPFADSLVHLLNPNLRDVYRICRKWSFRIEISFGYDPTRCSCGNYMEFFFLVRLHLCPLKRCNSTDKEVSDVTQIITMKKSEYDKMTAEKLRQQFIVSPPDGYTANEIRTMSVNDILDMNYFLNEDCFCAEDDDMVAEPDTIIQLIDDYPKEPDDDIPL